MGTRTLGVEEEFLVYDRDTSRLRDFGPVVAAAAERRVANGEGADDEAQFQQELMQAQAEHATPPATLLAALADDLTAQRRELIDSAAERGTRLVASGTSPLPDTSALTDDKRYRQMADRFAVVARSQLSCAMHVHVSVASDAEGVAVLDRIAPWLHVLLALSANSPFVDGRDTGYACYRRLLWGLWPTSGPTAAFGDLATYRNAVNGLVATGAARDRAMIYFDARLSADYPTVELRVCDVVRDVGDAVTIAGLARALVGALARDERAVPVRVEWLHAAGWRAARFGTTDRLVDLTGRGGPRLVPAWQLIDALVDYAGAELDAAGDRDRVTAGLAAIRRRGTGAVRQRDAARDGDLAAVIDVMTLTRDD